MSQRELRRFRQIYGGGACLVAALLGLAALLCLRSPHVWLLSFPAVCGIILCARFWRGLWALSEEELRAVLIKRGYKPFKIRLW